MRDSGKTYADLQAEAEALRLDILLLDRNPTAKMSQAAVVDAELKHAEQTAATEAITRNGNLLLKECESLMAAIAKHDHVAGQAQDLDARLVDLTQRVDAWRTDTVTELSRRVENELAAAGPMGELDAKAASLQQHVFLFKAQAGAQKTVKKQSSCCDRFVYAITCGLFGRPAIENPALHEALDAYSQVARSGSSSPSLG